jgi:hypothetical protein
MVILFIGVDIGREINQSEIDWIKQKKYTTLAKRYNLDVVHLTCIVTHENGSVIKVFNFDFTGSIEYYNGIKEFALTLDTYDVEKIVMTDDIDYKLVCASLCKFELYEVLNTLSEYDIIKTKFEGSTNAFDKATKCAEMYFSDYTK